MIKFSILLLLVLTAIPHTRVMAQNPIPNPSFESWEDTAGWGGSLPEGWFGFANDGLVTQSTDAQSGSFALGGANIPVSGTSGDTNNAPFLWYASSDESSLNGFPIDFMPLAFEGYYKLTSVGNDALEIDVFFQKQGNVIGAAYFIDSTSTSNYQHFSVPPDLLFEVPDTVTMFIMMNNTSGATHIGSSFTLDDLTLTGSSSVSPVQQRSSELETNFPNPFSRYTTIRYSLSASGMVSLTVFNVLGEPVALLENGIESAGPHEVRFERGDLPTGIYSYRLTTPDGQSTMRFLQIIK